MPTALVEDRHTLLGMDPHDYLRHTLDPVRLAILGAGMVGPVDADEIARGLGVKRQKVLLQMARLTETGLLTSDRRVDHEQLRQIGAQLPDVEAAASEITDGAWSAEESKILRSFFEGSRLTSIPSSRSKRLVVLERLAQEFDVGLRYPEKQVSFLLQLFYPDYAALRRYLVDEGFLTRADGVYWRSGGRFDDEGGSGSEPVSGT